MTKPNRKLACLQDLRSRILTLDIAPGSDLDETGLSEAYGISRTPLREVFQRLAGEGFIQLSDQRGAKVASMDLPVMQTFFRTAPFIYSTMARLAAENRSDAQIEELKAVQLRFSRAVSSGKPVEMALANHRFHELIGEMAANVYLMPTLRRLLIDHTRLGQTFYRPSAPPESAAVTQACQQHEAMIVAIEMQEPDVAVDLTLQHWDLSRGRVERFVRPDPLPLDVAITMEDANAV